MEERHGIKVVFRDGDEVYIDGSRFTSWEVVAKDSVTYLMILKDGMLVSWYNLKDVERFEATFDET